MVGATRENVNCALRRFSDLGTIRLDHGAITVLNTGPAPRIRQDDPMFITMQNQSQADLSPT